MDDTAEMSGFCEQLGLGFRRSLAVGGLLTASAIAAYSNTFYAPFVFDGVNLATGLRQLCWDPREWFLPRPRAFGFFTFDVQYTLHDAWLPGFHAVSIAIHVIAACALYGVVLLTCRRPTMPTGIRRDAAGIAVASALLFELHPLQTQAVTYLYQRFESLMGMFFLLAMLCFALATRAEPVARWQRLGWFVATWLAVILSITSKEVGVVAPLVLLWYDRVFVADSWRNLVAARWWFYVPFGAVVGAAVAYVTTNLDHYITGGLLATDDISPLRYALSQPGVICHYLLLTVWPRGQCLDLYWPAADSFAGIGPPLIVIGSLLFFTLWAAVHHPAIGFLLASFFLILAPTSSIAPIIDLAFEHRMYLPLACLAVLATLIARHALRSLAERAGFAAVPPLWAAGLLTLVAASLGVTTFLRNQIYASHRTVWQDVVEKAPWNPRGWAGLGDEKLEAGDLEGSLANLNRSLELSANSPKAYAIRARIFARLGQDAAAVSDARAALMLDPSNRKALDVLGESLVWLTENDEAMAVSQKLLTSDPPSADRFADRHGPRMATLAAALAGLTSKRTAADDAALIRLLDNAKRFDPDSPRTKALVGLTFKRMGKTEQARREFQEVLQLDPGHPHVTRELATLSRAA